MIKISILWFKLLYLYSKNVNKDKCPLERPDGGQKGTMVLIYVELWKSFLDASDSLQKIKIPRALYIVQSFSIELHGFLDAPEQVYAAVIYVRCEPLEGSVMIRQIISKTGIAIKFVWLIQWLQGKNPYLPNISWSW